MQQGSNINPEIFDDMLKCAANAGAKGQSQFFTPLDLGRLLCQPLPRHRTHVVDFNCGAGHLLRAAANRTTEVLLGCDIDPCTKAPDLGRAPCTTQRVTGDLTQLFPLMVDVEFEMDLAVLNPPWDLHFYRERLASLEDSDLPTVRAAFSAHDGRTSRDCIDSTVAVLMMALDRCTAFGEGLLIANNSTLNRLIFNPGAPHGRLADHVWARIVIPGNPMTGLADHAFGTKSSEDTPAGAAGFQTGVVYFAASHLQGRAFDQLCASQEQLEAAMVQLVGERFHLRKGAEIREFNGCRETRVRWTAVAEEWKARQKEARSDFNLWLAPEGVIRTGLSLFDQKSSRLLKEQAARLKELDGKRPMALVMQRAQRDALLAACGSPAATGPWGKAGRAAAGASPATPWRVDPKLLAEVEACIRQYHACRAPLYRLPEIQRLGYLEEEDWIECKLDVLPVAHTAPTAPTGQMLAPSPGGEGRGEGERGPAAPRSSAAKSLCPLFKAGQSYRLTTKSVSITRKGLKPNLEGAMDEIEYTGQELCFLIIGEDGVTHVFMEARLRDPKIKIETVPVVEFTLQDLVAHFVIPEVPDVADLDPEGYQRNLTLMRELEAACS